MYAFGVALGTHACNVVVGLAVTTTTDVRCREIARQNADAGEFVNLSFDTAHAHSSSEWGLICPLLIDATAGRQAAASGARIRVQSEKATSKKEKD